MSTDRPASLDGSLLARKGDAAPAIGGDSPLLEELGEPRPDQRGSRSRRKKSATGQDAAALGFVGKSLDWLAKNPVYGILALAIAVAILFTLTITVFKPAPDTTTPDGAVSRMPVPEPSAAAPEATEKLVPPTDANSLSGASEETGDAAGEAITRPADSTTEASPPPALTVPSAPPVPGTLAPVTSRKPPAESPAVAPRTKRPVVAAPPVRSGRYLLQLAAVPTARAARQELARLERRLGSTLGKRKIRVVKAVPPGKPAVYRLRAGSYLSRKAASAACRQVRKKNLACWVVER